MQSRDLRDKKAAAESKEMHLWDGSQMKELRTTVELPLTKDLALDPGKRPRPPLPFPRECDRAAEDKFQMEEVSPLE